MKKIPRLLPLVSLAVSIFFPPARAASPAIINLAGTELAFHPDSGSLLLGDRAVPYSRKWSDSKGLDFRISPDHTLRIYAGARMGKEMGLPQTDLNRHGKNEIRLLEQWAQLGLARPVVASGMSQGEEPVFYALMNRPRAGRPVSHYVKSGAFAGRIEAQVKALVDDLVRRQIELGTFNPTQMHLARADDHVLLVKAYHNDGFKGRGDLSMLREYYQKKLVLFRAMSKMYQAKREDGPPLSDGRHTADRTVIAKMIFEGLRSRKDMRITYLRPAKPDEKNAGKPNFIPKKFHIRPLPRSLYYDDFLKGYIRVLMWAEEGKAWRDYTLRLDRIQSAEFL